MRLEWAGGIAIVVLFAAMSVSGCTTYVRPTTCDRGSSACAGIHDARFCEGLAIAVEGVDCGALGIVASKHFCVVAPVACTETDYAVKDRDCRVLRYETVRDRFRAECGPEVPMFVAR